MESVKDILNHKGSQVWAVNPDTKVFDALKLMGEKNIGAVLVVDNKENLKGIFSERDYARYAVGSEEGKECPWDHKVGDLMTKEVLYVTEDKSVDYCMGLMTSKRLRHIPVLHDEKIIGLISIGDIVKAVLGEKDFIIDQMEHYIWDNA